MTELELNDISLVGVSVCLPPKIVDNIEACKKVYGDTSKASSVVKATGIKRRRVVENGTTSLDLCCAAARRLLADVSCSSDEIGALVGVSFTPARQMTCNACAAQARLGLPTGIMAFDINLAFHHSPVDEVAKLTTAELCSQHLSQVANGYNKTKLREDAFPIETLSDAYHRAFKRDAEVAGGDKPNGVTTRVYQVWHNILMKALASQLPDVLRDLADEVKASGGHY